VGAKHLLSSAKLNKGVDELFLELAKGELVWKIKCKIWTWFVRVIGSMVIVRV
jgi:hypothetical protein